MSAGQAKRALTDQEERKVILDAWKAIVEVQMHFNDMVMRVRNLGVTLILAVFGAAAFSLQYELYFVTPCGRVHLAALIVVFGLVAWLGIWFMDRYYNKLLAGAVKRSTAIEDAYDADWLGMTHDITEESRTLFRIPNIMKARNQMAMFLYLPVVIVGILYIVAVAKWFEPSYKSSSGPPSVGSAKVPVAPQPLKAPSTGQAPALAPSVRPPTQTTPGGEGAAPTEKEIAPR